MDRLTFIRRALSPAGTLLACLAVALALALLPTRWTDRLKSQTSDLLRPGQTVGLAVRSHGERAMSALQSHIQSADHADRLQTEVDRLRQENQRLSSELLASQNAAKPHEDSTAPDPLLVAHCCTARVLGRQARAFLARQHLLDQGANSGVEPDSLVLDHPPLIDEGRDAQLAAGQLVLSGRRVWGKIIEIGAYTSTMCTMTEANYRDLVQIGDKPDRRGILEGTGEPLARIRLVDVTEPVAVGDPVYAAAEKGVVPVPLLYGRVSRLERPAGAAHWEIWVAPALSGEPARVEILQIELNPTRAADKK